MLLVSYGPEVKFMINRKGSYVIAGIFLEVMGNELPTTGCTQAQASQRVGQDSVVKDPRTGRLVGFDCGSGSSGQVILSPSA